MQRNGAVRERNRKPAMKNIAHGSQRNATGRKRNGGLGVKTLSVVNKEIEGWERKTSLKGGKEIVAGKE